MNYIKTIILTTLAAVLLNQSALAEKKPNIIILFADDISARELPFYGSSKWSVPIGGDLEGGSTSDMQYRANTPNLDRMAREGCYFKTTWASTICGPSRAMMMTGRYAHLHKWWHNSDKGKAPDGKSSWRLYESSPHIIAHIAKKGGYETYWAGKAQMDDVRYFGFDEACLTPGQGSYNKAIHTTDFRLESRTVDGETKIFNADADIEIADHAASRYVQSGWYFYPHVQLLNHPDAEDDLEWFPNNAAAADTFGVHSYGPDIELEFALNFMERKVDEDKPFFIYHTSHLGHDAYDFLHLDEGNKWPGTPKIEWDGRKYILTKPNITGDKGVYDTHGTLTEDGIHTHINYLDFQVWQYLNKLKELGVENNTIFVFCADNGTSGYGKGLLSMQKGPHVPLLVYAPGMNLSKQGLQDILVDMSDIVPTVADIAGVKIPDSYEINGKSLYPYLFTREIQHREYIYSYHKETQFVRGKYVLKDGKDSWYDVSTNPRDLESFTKITNWDNMPQTHKDERTMLEGVLDRFDLHATEHDAPAGGYGEQEELRLLTTEEIDELNEGTSKLSSHQSKTIKIYPNPVKYSLNIEANAGSYYTIYDNTGCSVVRNTLQVGRILDVENLKNGIYYLELESQILRFVKG